MSLLLKRKRDDMEDPPPRREAGLVLVGGLGEVFALFELLQDLVGTGRPGVSSCRRFSQLAHDGWPAPIVNVSRDGTTEEVAADDHVVQRTADPCLLVENCEVHDLIEQREIPERPFCWW